MFKLTATLLFSVILALSGGTLIACSNELSVSDSTEWAVWGDSQAFLLKFERLVSDTTVLHGDFEASFEGRLIMKGKFRKSRKEGLWQHFDMNTGKLTAEGNYMSGMRHNTWNFFTANGKKAARKRFYYGELRGQISSWYDSGSKRSEIIVENDSLIKSLNLFYENGDTCIHRDFKLTEAGTLEVNHRSYYKDGPRYESYSYRVLPQHPEVRRRLQGLADPLWLIYLTDPVNDPRTPKEAFPLDGSYRKFHDSGYLWEHLNYVDGQLFEIFENTDQWGKPKEKGDLLDGSGTRISYHRGGDTALIATYENGWLDGRAQFFEEENRKIFDGEFSGGQPAGHWIKYDRDGRIRYEYDFKGDTINVKETRRNDIQDHLGYYVNGMKQDRWVTFDFYGDTAKYIEFDEGKLDGHYREFQRASLFQSGQYKSGVPTGTWNTYNIRGKITWTDTIPEVALGNDLPGQQEIFFGSEIVSDFKFRTTVNEARLPQILDQWTTQRIGDKFYKVRITAGHAYTLGQVVFLVNIEDTGHITALESLKFNRVEFYEYALGVLQQLPFMYPMQVEGIPRNSVQRIGFLFEEI